MNNLSELFEEQIQDLYSAEQQLTRALPKMIKAVSTSQLKDAMSSHLEETHAHVKRLQQIADAGGFKSSGKACAGMKGLLEEGSEAAGEEGDEAVIDAAIIAAAQRVEHYEIAAYGTCRALAQLLGHADAAALLSQTLEEESAADEKLSQVAQRAVYPNAPANDDTEDAPAKRKSGRRPPGKGRKRPDGVGGGARM